MHIFQPGLHIDTGLTLTLTVTHMHRIRLWVYNAEKDDWGGIHSLNSQSSALMSYKTREVIV